MSQIPALLHGPAWGHWLPRAPSAAVILITVSATALISSLVTAEALKRTPDVAGPRTAAIPTTATAATTARAAPAAAPGTSVPDAGSVFAGKEAPAEEAAPTF